MNSKAYGTPALPVATRPRLRLAVSLEDGPSTQVPAVTFELLRRLARADSLREAANGFGFSYRYAWGLIRTAEATLGSALVETRRGQGTRLTGYGALLAAALAEIESQLAPELEAATQAFTAALAIGAQRQAGVDRSAKVARVANAARVRAGQPREGAALGEAWATRPVRGTNRSTTR